MIIDESATRLMVNALLLGKDARKMDRWIASGILAGTLDGPTVERVMQEEILKMPFEVKAYWAAPCDQCLMEEAGHEH